MMTLMPGLYRISGIGSHVTALLESATEGADIVALLSDVWASHTICSAVKKFLSTATKVSDARRG
jgi:hypothetical protein